MQQYADLLTARLQQRQAMRATEAVPLASGAAPQDDDSDFDDDEAQMPLQQQKPAVATKRQRASQDEQVGPHSLPLVQKCGLASFSHIEHASHACETAGSAAQPVRVATGG
jgi:hypothetical protein